MAVINGMGRWATEGARFQRHNGDGTIPTPSRFLGFANYADLSGVETAAGAAPINFRVDSGPIIAGSVDLALIDDVSHVTVDEAVEALNAAGLSGVTFSKDPATTRLKGSAAGGGRIVQIWSPLAGALDFGQSVRHGGEGLKVLSFFSDELISITMPKDVKDREEIDLESAKGTIKRMIIGATYLGMSPVITLNQKNYDLVEMVQGGKLDRAAGTYNPPKPNESEHPSFWYEIFSAIYGEGSHNMGNVGGYERLLLRNAIGIEGDTPIDTKAWTTYPMQTTCTGYTDENGVTHTAWEEQTLTLEQFDALRVNRISV